MVPPHVRYHFFQDNFESRSTACPNETVYSTLNIKLADLAVQKVKDLSDKEEVRKAIRTSVMSKQHGNEDFLAKIIADACSK